MLGMFREASRAVLICEILMLISAGTCGNLLSSWSLLSSHVYTVGSLTEQQQQKAITDVAKACSNSTV